MNWKKQRHLQADGSLRARSLIHKWILMEVRATWQLKMWQLSVSLSDDCGFCEGFFFQRLPQNISKIMILVVWNHGTLWISIYWEFHHHWRRSSLLFFGEKMAQPPVPIAPTAQAPRNPRRRGRWLLAFGGRPRFTSGSAGDALGALKRWDNRMPLVMF